MKKNKMMRLASCLLVAVMLTTSVISGTFAKYTTTVSGSDEARVAAWGFGTTTKVDFDLFSEEYDGTVDSIENDVNVIAPGTTQTEVVKLTYADTTGKGAPEVDYTIDINVTANTIGAGIKANKAIVWSFNGKEYDHTESATSWDLMIAAIEAYHEDVQANKLPALSNNDIEISWEWVFDNAYADQDATDTALGDAATLETVQLGIEIVAVQVN